MTAKKYIFVFSAMLALLVLLVVGFNRVVDPFWYYRDFVIDGFNVVKPRFKKYERHVKPALVQREQPASLIFGSSYSEIGFNPKHPALRAAGKSYNFALAGASWDMVYCDVQFALKHDAALRQIVLGIHPDTLPQKECREEIVKMENPEERAFLFSYDALETSINTVLEQPRRKPTHTAEGLYFYTRGISGTDRRFREHFALYTPCRIDHVSASVSSTALNKQINPDLSGLLDIVRQTKKRGIVLKVFVYPRHALSFEQEYQCGTRQVRWDTLKQVVSAVEAEKSNLVEVWDFEGYHAIGTDTISDAAGANWQDPAHFNFEVGNIMLDEMFAIKKPVFGERLTSKNMAARVAAERKQRAAYLEEHPEFLKQLESLLPHRAN